METTLSAPVHPIPPPTGDTVVYLDAGYVLSALSTHQGASMSGTIFNSPGIAAVITKEVATQLGTSDATLRWYDGVDPVKRVETPWVAALRNDPSVVLRLGRATIRDDRGLEQKRVDTLLVADVIEAVYAPDPPSDLVIMSGDEDLTPAVDVAIRRGVRVHLATVTNSNGARLGVSRHLRLSATSELRVDIGDLLPLAKNRSRLFAQMAGLAPKPVNADTPLAGDACPDADRHGTEVDCADGDEEVGEQPIDDGTTLTDGSTQGGGQPVLPGMPPSPPRRAQDLEALFEADPDALRAAEQLGLEDRIQAGLVSRAYLAGRAYAHRWWARTSPEVRDEKVRQILDGQPFLPSSVDRGLLRFAGAHVGIRQGQKANKVDVRAGFGATVRRLAGVTSVDGLDVALPAGADGLDVALPARAGEPFSGSGERQTAA